MRRAPIAVAALAASLLAAAPATAQVDCVTPGEEWTIESFRTDYVVRTNGSVGVVERIEVDFGESRKHGIYRDIEEGGPGPRPRLGDAAGRPAYRIDVARVTDPRGAEYGTKVTREGGRVRIRIGDPDFCVTGRRTYLVHYEISDGIGRFDGWDELYWQVTGTGWPVPIRRAEAQVILPSERALAFADREPWDASCYAGPPASTSSAGCRAEVVSPGVFRIVTTAPLDPGEGLTFAATFPPGLVPGPTALERALERAVLWSPAALPLLALGVVFGLWWTRGRDPGAGSVVPRWDPPEALRPGPAGTLVDQRADMDDVIATILDLAVRGHLRIREVPPRVLPAVREESILGRALGALGVRREDWEFVRLRDEPHHLEPFEARVMDALLGTAGTRRLSDLEKKFYEDIPGIRDTLYADLVGRGLFPRSPESTRRRWMGLGAALLVVGGALGILALTQGWWLPLPAFVVSAAVVFAFAPFMPAATLAGARLRRHVRGLEEYIRRAEKAELEFGQAPERTADLFERLLPYAVALDVSDIWVEQFEGVLRSQPDWYVGRSPGWDSAGFGRGLSGFRTAAAGALASTPGGGGSGSFGGGSVGGGGGGGGGGSW